MGNPPLPQTGAATDNPYDAISHRMAAPWPGIQLNLTPNRSRQEFRMRFGLPEMLVVLFIVLLIFGANRLPGLAKGVGQSIKNFKDAVKEGDEKKP